MRRESIEKSIHYLSQPYTYGALIIYALNESFLQRYFPSWLSGKLSDFAWLFIAPVILTLLFSFLPQFTTHKKSIIISLLAYGITALFFIELKTNFPFHDFILHSWRTVFHQPAMVVMDVTDLLALLILPVSYLLWQNEEVKYAFRLRHTVFLFFLFSFLTLADASALNRGVFNLYLQQNQILAQVGYGDTYLSEDGGYTWVDCEHTNKCISTSVNSEIENTTANPNSEMQYRFLESGRIEISQDAGLNWRSLDSNIYLSDAAAYYLQQTRPNAASMNPGAQDLLYDPDSGNVLIAMGLQGILIIEPDGNIMQVGIAENQPANLADPWVFATILFPFLLLSLAVVLIFYAFIIIFAGKRLYKVLSIFALLAWAFLVLELPELFSGYAIVFGIPILIVVLGLIIWLLFCTNTELNRTERKTNKHKLHVLLTALPGGLAFFLCYVLWYFNIIPRLEWANAIGYGIVLVWFIYCIVQSFRGYPLNGTYEQ